MAGNLAQDQIVAGKFSNNKMVVFLRRLNRKMETEQLQHHLL